ncbi:MAG: hypothetical protein H6621_12390 [Halobacteriovoraceae bacterium]|nr:hypothetical protein [Halobacteriovoraceae bacterium]
MPIYREKVFKMIISLFCLTMGFQAEAARMEGIDLWVDDEYKVATYFTQPNVEIQLIENAQDEQYWGSMIVDLRYYYFEDEKATYLKNLKEKYPGYLLNRIDIRKSDIEQGFYLKITPLDKKIEGLDTFSGAMMGVTRVLWFDKGDFQKLVETVEKGEVLLEWGNPLSWRFYFQEKTDSMRLSKNICSQIFKDGIQGFQVLRNYFEIVDDISKKPNSKDLKKELSEMLFDRCIYVPQNLVINSFRELFTLPLAKVEQAEDIEVVRYQKRTLENEYSVNLNIDKVEVKNVQ